MTEEEQDQLLIEHISKLREISVELYERITRAPTDNREEIPTEGCKRWGVDPKTGRLICLDPGFS
ncbi:MAG: hypothetical protein COB20_02555 [SAR86 cluster bacterium]|uniref:Uncharacterized protein n=1 Tax=SAR86 cluster bacterium TaxID=2030880 RepID=A0A2A4XEE8_9GAMM|nr:MAG: hypothetical protein COB20_02555 [SAR86 cluster bacterium]